jgi:hypothetical protein
VAVLQKYFQGSGQGNMEYLYLSVKGKEQLILSHNTLVEEMEKRTLKIINYFIRSYKLLVLRK